MTTTRDPDALLAAYLADGMSVLPDRVVDAVLDEVHRTRQRAVLGPWRTLSMFKIGLAAAAVVVLVVGGGVLLGAFPAPLGPGAPSPTPGATPSTTPAPSPTPGLAGFPGSGPRVTLTSGATYQAVPFSQPMKLTMPDDGALGADAVVEGFTYAGGHTMQISYGPMNVGMTIHDDFRIDTNLCMPTGAVQEVPATPEAVGAWLHDQLPTWVGIEGETKWVVDQPDMTVDGRVAKVFDVRTSHDCRSDTAVGDVSTYSNQLHRFYAIPTGTDTILVITWNQGGTMSDGIVNDIADQLVESLEFE